MGLTSVIEELEEQLRYAKEIDGPEDDYTVQLEKAIQILKEHEHEDEDESEGGKT